MTENAIGRLTGDAVTSRAVKTRHAQPLNQATKQAAANEALLLTLSAGQFVTRNCDNGGISCDLANATVRGKPIECGGVVPAM